MGVTFYNPRTKKNQLGRLNEEFVIPQKVYRRTSNLLDALIGNKNVVSYLEIYADTFNRQKELELVKGALIALKMRGIVSSHKMGEILGHLYGPDFLWSNNYSLIDLPLKQICLLWKYAKPEMIRDLKWKHYYESKGVSKNMFNHFRAEIKRCETGTAVAAVLLKYKAQIYKKNYKYL